MPTLDLVPGLTTLRARTHGDASVLVGLLDGPVDRSHPCFVGAELRSLAVDWTDRDGADATFEEHGTGIASQLFGQPGSPVEGIAPRVSGLLVPSAASSTDITELSLVRSIERALVEGVDILHCAFCLPRGLPKARIGTLLRGALAKARAAGVLVVAPSGNDAGTCSCAPADQPGVLAVGGLDDDGSVRASSNHGAAFDGHGIMAWAENVLVAAPGGGTSTHAGTSVAAPWVTGVAALLLTVSRSAGLGLAPADVGQLLCRTARPVNDDRAERAIGGILDPEAALAELDAQAILGTAHQPLTGAGNGGARLSGASATLTGVTPSLRFPTYLYALGQLDVEPRDEIARKRLTLSMRERDRGSGPDEARELLAHLRDRIEDRDLVTWVLRIGGEPHYALRPAGPHAADVVQRLLELGSETVEVPAAPRLVDRVVVPGIVLPETTMLRRGEVVRIARIRLPDALSGWRTRDVADAALAALGVDPRSRSGDLLLELLDHLCEARLTDGLRAPERALNHTATNAVQLAMVAQAMSREQVDLVRIDAAPSRYDRPRSECWDIRAWFRDPRDPARSWWQWVWTVDVGDERPVTINHPRCWRIAGEPTEQEE